MTFSTKAKLNLWTISPHEGHPLRYFMAWRKRGRATGSFAYAQLDTTLHRDLSTVDNCLLAMNEPPSDAPHFEKEVYVRKAIEREGLNVLLPWFSLGKARAAGLTSQERAVAAICCALLSRSEATLIDLGKLALDELCLVQIKNVLRTHAQGTIVIATQRPEDWTDLTQEYFDPWVTIEVKKSA